MEELQRHDEGHRPGLLDFSQVAMEFVMNENFSLDNLASWKLIENEEDRKVIEFKLSDGKSLQLEVIQPVKNGLDGIYTVSKYRIIETE